MYTLRKACRLQLRKIIIWLENAVFHKNHYKTFAKGMKVVENLKIGSISMPSAAPVRVFTKDFYSF